ncbi:MAG: DUF547 domain-containing protein, partial [Bacteroidetes bacterium]|nr:DUF547 domain-containing protein [Bacteroidota bacterium]MBU1759541.1 DUF547 domain-containing protein [Bacteroidota bacterium]
MNTRKMKIVILTGIIIATISSCGIKRPSQVNQNVQTTEYNTWSENLLKDLKAGKNVDDIQKKLAQISENDLENGLPLDEN